MELSTLLHISTHTLVSYEFSHLKRGCHSHNPRPPPVSNKHFLGPWSNNSGNNIQRRAMTGIVSALFISEVICEVLLTGGRENTLTGSNGIWPNGNDILTAAICKVRAPRSCRGGCVTRPPPELTQWKGSNLSLRWK